MSIASEQTFDGVFWIDSPTYGRYPLQAHSIDRARELFHQGFPELDEEPTITPGDWDAVRGLARMGYGVVDPCEWEPYVPAEANSGGYTYLRVKRVKTVGEVCDELARYLSRRAGEDEGYCGWTEWMDGIEEGLSVCSWSGVDARDQRELSDAVTALDAVERDIRDGIWSEATLADERAKWQAEVARLREKCKPLNERSWPTDARIAVFSVRGGSEGDYVHVEALKDGKATLLMLAKTFQGRDAAWIAARRIADLLGV